MLYLLNECNVGGKNKVGNPFGKSVMCGLRVGIASIWKAGCEY
jgi:hypothetical protein